MPWPDQEFKHLRMYDPQTNLGTAASWPLNWGSYTAATNEVAIWGNYGRVTVWRETRYPDPPTTDFGSERQARRQRSRAKAVPPVHIPGNADDRVSPLDALRCLPSVHRPGRAWLTARRGAPRQATCSRSRHRQRTWERSETPPTP